MREKIEKIYSSKIINYIFILFPIIELITSVQKSSTNINITLGSIYKLVFIVYALIYLLIYNKHRRKEIFIILGGIVMYAIINLFITTNCFMGETTNSLDIISKPLTYIVSFIFFYSYIKNGNKLEYKTITYIALLYTLFINIATITNTAIATYENDTSLGTTGWYYSANELNVLLIMFLPITIYNSAKECNFINFITNLLLVYSLLSIGTKTSLLAIFAAIILILFFAIINRARFKNIFSKRLLYLVIIIAVFTLIVMPYTASYNHFVKRLNDNFNIEDSSINNNEDQLSSFIYNGRNEYLDAQKEIYNSTTWFERFFGLKMENRIKGEDGVNYKLIEMDVYDIIISFGFIGVIIYYLPIILVLSKLIHKICTKSFITEKNILTLISIILVVIISTMAGHVLLSSTIVIFLAYGLGILNTYYEDDNYAQNISLKSDVKLHSNKDKKKLIICTQRLSVGGMERAYINLLNMSDVKDKFEVWAYVTYVQDNEFLKELPQGINVHIVCNKKWTFINKIASAIKILIDTVFSPAFDYAICYGHSNGLLAMLTKKLSKNNIIFVHADLANRTPKQIKRLDKVMKFNQFKKVVCVSNKARESFIKLFNNSNVQVINNYINAKNILISAEESVTFEVDKLCTNFVMVCRLEEKSKKITRVIQASRKLIENGYKFKVYILGSGQDEKMYKKQVQLYNLQNTIIFLGSKTNPYPYMKKCDALLFTSIYEGYGIVLDEARVLNIPFISTDVADAKKIAKDGFGMICENTEDGVYNAMKTFLCDGYKLIKSFDYDKFNNNVTKSINKLLEE